jgi:hypothetical protein
MFPFAARWTQLVADANRVFLFFRGATGGDTPVWMTMSDDRGTNWTAVTAISDTAGEIRSAAISAETLSVIYNPFNDFKKILRSTDGGQTWTRTNEDLNYHARVALSPGVLHLVQIAGGGFGETEYRRSHDLG